MQKELNRELFGVSGRPEPKTQAKSVKTTVQPPTYLVDQEKKLVQIKADCQFLHDQLAKVVRQVNEFIKYSQNRFDKIQKDMARMEKAANDSASEVSTKISLIHHRVGERKSVDAKIQEMMDRHNTVLRSFELKVTHLQKLLMEKENQSLAAQAALRDAKAEITRLKRL